MQENSNRAIAVNSVIMYARMFINTFLALLTTRYALKALGVEDFGLFSVLGSIISFMGVFNNIMLSTCNRFITVAIGSGNKEEINKVFNVNLIIFIGCALLLLIFGLPIGDWYVRHNIIYNGPLKNILFVFYFSLIGSIVSTLTIPFNGLMMAKERFLIFSFVDVVIHLIKFCVAILLVRFSNKLQIYTISQAFTSLLVVIIYYIYCKVHFNDIVKFKFVNDREMYSKIFGFSGWVSYGAMTCVLRSQAPSLLINKFFSATMNAALGIANSLNMYIMMFANNLTKPIEPQITKNYVAGNYARTNELLIMSTKFSFLLMLLIGAPFFAGAEWILRLWLGEVPAYTVHFTILLIIDSLVTSFNSGLSLILFADGRIAVYQILINTLRLFSVVVAFFALKVGADSMAIYYVYIFFSLLIIIATQWCLHYILKYDNRDLVRFSYLPSLSVLLLFLPILMIPNTIHAFIRIIVTVLYLLVLEFYIGLNKKERRYVMKLLHIKTE